MLTLEHKVAVITGAASGIGFATTKLLLSLGAAVVAVDIKPYDKEEHLLLQQQYQNLLTLNIDIGQKDAAQEIINASYQRFQQIDIIINNASALYIRGILDCDFDRWQHALTIDLIAPMKLIHAALPYLTKQGGSIINIGSDSINITKPEFLTYSTNKSALFAATKALAVDLAPYKIRVNMISPGTTYTPYLESFARANNYPTELSFFDAHPDFGGKNLFNRIATPSDITPMIAFLASNQSRFITGANIPIDAGAHII